MIRKLLAPALALLGAFFLSTAQAVNYDSTPIFSQDFEDETTWEENCTFEVTGGSSHDRASRTKFTGDDSYFMHLTAEKNNSARKSVVTCDISSVTNQCANGYRIECDWFANAGYNGNQCHLQAKSNGSEYLILYHYNGNSDKNTTGQIYTNGVHESGTELGTFSTADRGGDCTNTVNQAKWYHVIIEGVPGDGVYLTMTKCDTAATVVAARGRVGDFALIDSLECRVATKSYAAYGGIDDVIVYKALAASTFVWTGAAGDGLWTTPGNWSVGGVAQTELYPSDADTATIGDDVTITVPAGIVFGTLNLGSGVTFNVLFDDDNLSFTVPDGATAAAYGPYSTTLADGVLSATRVASTFTWGGANGNWSDADKWLVGGKATGVAPGADDSVVFGDDCDAKTVTLSANAAVETISFGAASVTFTGSYTLVCDVTTNLENKVGKMVLAGDIHLRTPADKAGKFYVDVEVPENETAYIDNVNNGNNKTSYSSEVYGALTGKGTLHCKNASANSYVGVQLYGDLSGFEGTLIADDKNAANASRNNFKIYDGDGDGIAGSSNACWEIHSSQASGYDCLISGITYYFGSLNGGVYQKSGNAAALIEIGALGLDGNFGGDIASTPIRKVGTGTLTCSASNIGDIEIAGGCFALNANTQKGDVCFTGIGEYRQLCDNGDLSKKFTGSTAFPVVYHDGNTNRTWQNTFLGNTAGFTKRGSGVLTMEKAPTTSGPYTIAEGGLILPKGATIDGSLTVSAGATIAFSEALSGEEETLLSWTAEGSSVALDKFDVSVSSPLELAIETTDGVASLVVKREALTYTWVGVTGGKWSVASNWQVAGETAAMAPGAEDKVTFNSDATVVVTPGQAFGTITKGENEVKLAIAVTAAGEVSFTKPEGFADADIIAAGPFTLAYADDVWTATRVPSTFVWTGAAEDDIWQSLANWEIDSLPVAVLPNADDAAVFPANVDGWRLTVGSSDANISNVTLNADLTLDSGNKSLRPKFIVGDGVLKLNGGSLNHQNAEIVISNDVFVAEGTTNLITILTKQYCRIYGDITGSGTLKWNFSKNEASGTWAGLDLHGDNTAFAGVFEQEGGYAGRSGTSADENSWSSNAVWKCDFRAKADTTYLFPINSAFGALIGAIQCGNRSSNIEIGNRDDIDSVFTIVNRTTGGGVSQGFNITKVGSAKLTLPTTVNMNNENHPNSGILSLDIKGGTAEIPRLADIATDRPSFIKFNGEGATLMATPYTVTNDEVEVTQVADPSDVIKNSTSAITYDSNGTDAVWATALDASNTSKAIVKKGAGTLTLSAAPAWEGKTTLTVEAGEVVLPASAPVKLGVMTRVKATVGDTKVYEHGEPTPGLLLFLR